MGDGILDFRRRHGDDRFVDVAYREPDDAQPVETVQADLRRGWASRCPTEAEAAMRAHAAVAVQHRFGKHEYSWETWGWYGTRSTSSSPDTAPASPSTCPDLV